MRLKQRFGWRAISTRVSKLGLLEVGERARADAMDWLMDDDETMGRDQ